MIHSLFLLSLFAELTNPVAPVAVPANIWQQEHIKTSMCQDREDKHHAQVPVEDALDSTDHPLLPQCGECEVSIYDVHRNCPTAPSKLISLWEAVAKDIPKAIMVMEASCHASNESVRGTQWKHVSNWWLHWIMPPTNTMKLSQWLYDGHLLWCVCLHVKQTDSRCLLRHELRNNLSKVYMLHSQAFPSWVLDSRTMLATHDIHWSV